MFICGTLDGLIQIGARRHNTEDIIATVLAVEPHSFIYKGRCVEEGGRGRGEGEGELGGGGRRGEIKGERWSREGDKNRGRGGGENGGGRLGIV